MYLACGDSLDWWSDKIIHLILTATSIKSTVLMTHHISWSTDCVLYLKTQLLAYWDTRWVLEAGFDNDDNTRGIQSYVCFYFFKECSQAKPSVIDSLMKNSSKFKKEFEWSGNMKKKNVYWVCVLCGFAAGHIFPISKVKASVESFYDNRHLSLHVGNLKMQREANQFLFITVINMIPFCWGKQSLLRTGVMQGVETLTTLWGQSEDNGICQYLTSVRI